MRISDWSSDVCSSDLRDPVEIRPKVFLDSGHEPPGERLEVVIFYPVLGAHNDAELVAIVARLLEPVVPVHLVRVGPIELPAPALARRAVALDVAQMRLGGIEALAAEFDGADFPDDAALAESGVAVARTTAPGRGTTAGRGK